MMESFEITADDASLLALPPSRGQFVTLIGTADGNLHAVDSSLRKIWTSSSGEALVSSRCRVRPTGSESEETDGKEKHSGSHQSEREVPSSVIPTLDGGLLYSGPE
ncbi:hypothetical protein EON64_04115, partial [archaeon]